MSHHEQPRNTLREANHDNPPMTVVDGSLGFGSAPPEMIENEADKVRQLAALLEPSKFGAIFDENNYLNLGGTELPFGMMPDLPPLPTSSFNPSTDAPMLTAINPLLLQQMGIPNISPDQLHSFSLPGFGLMPGMQTGLNFGLHGMPAMPGLTPNIISNLGLSLPG